MVTDLASPLVPETIAPAHRPSWLTWLSDRAPGLALTAGLAMLGMLVARLAASPLVSPMVVAMVAGIVLRNLTGLPAAVQPGIALSLRQILRLGVVLLGFRLTFGQLAEVGLAGVAVIAAVLAATFVFTRAAGRLMGVDRRLAELIAAGTSVCGASAVLAVNTVTEGTDEDVAYAIACVTLFGSLSMLILPQFAAPLGLTSEQFGLWAGASVHEVAQVVGTGFARGEAAGQVATVAKLSRVLMLAPLILALGWAARTGAAGGGTARGGRAPMPWFVLGFVAMVAVNSLGVVPAPALGLLHGTSTVLLTMALGAMGLETHLRRLRLRGVRPLALGALAWVFISVLALGLVRLV